MRDFFVVAPVVAAPAFQPFERHLRIAVLCCVRNDCGEPRFGFCLSNVTICCETRIVGTPAPDLGGVYAGSAGCSRAGQAGLKPFEYLSADSVSEFGRPGHTLLYLIYRFLSYIWGAKFHRVK